MGQGINYFLQKGQALKQLHCVLIKHVWIYSKGQNTEQKELFLQGGENLYTVLYTVNDVLFTTNKILTIFTLYKTKPYIRLSF